MLNTSTKKGDIYNNLEAIEFSHRTNNVTYWKFKCLVCNNQHIARLQDTRSGKVKSCGCHKNKGSNNGQWKGYLGLPGRVISHYEENAIKRGIFFNVSREYLWKIYNDQNKKCPYTGIDLILECKNIDSRTPSNASLDRIDSKLGYVVDNVQWVYKPINKLKGTLSHDEFINLCKLIYINNGKEEGVH
jgi:hypothetical protein